MHERGEAADDRFLDGEPGVGLLVELEDRPRRARRAGEPAVAGLGAGQRGFEQLARDSEREVLFQRRTGGGQDAHAGGPFAQCLEQRGLAAAERSGDDDPVAVTVLGAVQCAGELPQRAGAFEQDHHEARTSASSDRLEMPSLRYARVRCTSTVRSVTNR